MIYLNYFPNGNEEVNLIRFIAKYQYLDVNDSKFFFSSQQYYRKRITNLVQKEFIRRVDLKLVLGRLGIEYARLYNFEYTPLCRDKRYIPRLMYIRHFAAFYNDCETITFRPSFSIKEKDILTTKSRKFTGILNINGVDYLIYNIQKEHSKKYITSIMSDIQREVKYQNIIIFINDKKRLNIEEFAFGMNQLILLEDDQWNREKLKYLHSINWARIIEEYYDNKVFFAKYNFCDYTDYKSKYVSTFYFLDTEKIYKIRYFLRENSKKTADIICGPELEQDLKKELPNAHFCIVDLEKYIDKERIYYE